MIRDKILKSISLTITSLFLFACGSLDRTVRVVDVDTNEPIPDAFVYATNSDIVPTQFFNTYGFYKTDSNGLAPIEQCGKNIFVLAGKEGYNSWRTNEEIKKGDILETEIKLKKTPYSPPYKAKTISFRKFPISGDEAKIADEIKSYFAIRNTRIYFDEELVKVKLKIVVKDYDTKQPVPNAIIYFHSYHHSEGYNIRIAETDSNGIAIIPDFINSNTAYIDTGKEEYFPTVLYKKDDYEHDLIHIELGRKRLPNDKSLHTILLHRDSKLKKEETKFPLWERFKTYYISTGGKIMYHDEFNFEQRKKEVEIEKTERDGNGRK